MDNIDEQNRINEEPEKLIPKFNPFDLFLHFLALYGWWVIGGTVIILWLYSKIKPSVDKWKIQREDAAYHKDPDAVVQRLTAVEIARIKQQEIFNEKAKEFEEKQKEKEQKKREEFIKRNSGKSTGQKLGNNYFPLMGPGTSGGYRPPKKSKCSGGGCG